MANGTCFVLPQGHHYREVITSSQSHSRCFPKTSTLQVTNVFHAYSAVYHLRKLCLCNVEE